MTDSGKGTKSAHRVRLPSFLVESEIGLGDVLANATLAVGLRPCGGCKQRAEVLNRKVVLYSRPWFHEQNGRGR